MLYTILAAIVVVLVWGVAAYNGIITLRNQVAEGWSDIDVQLKQRYNLIPNLLNAIKEYEKHESGTLTQVTELRTKAMQAGTVAEKSKAEAGLTMGLNKLIAVAENYPDLKASANFLDFQQQLAKLEDIIQKARRYYNGTARDFNTKIQSFPTNLLANVFHFTKKEYFQLDDNSERAVPTVNFDQDNKNA